MDEVTPEIKRNLRFIRNRLYMDTYADDEAAVHAALTYERATYYSVPPLDIVAQVIEHIKTEYPNSAYNQALDRLYPMEETVLKKRRR
jgi:hypothetical protein